VEETSIYSILILGNGNVGSHLETAFRQCGMRAFVLSGHEYALNEKIRQCCPDVIILSVRDDAYFSLIDRFPKSDTVIVHTSGSVEMDVLRKTSPNIGVFYPLQTLTKGRDIDFLEVTICLEASNGKTKEFLFSLAGKITSRTHYLNSHQRLHLHLAACFASNYVNALYVAAEEILSGQDMDFSLLAPLVIETARKAIALSPRKSQTGPALRKDVEVRERHLALLGDTYLGTTYKQLFELIEHQQNILDHGKL
jgi:predicted short-subunit dehydrogenase-like oxidoreductase (DUF2520 family)